MSVVALEKYYDKKRCVSSFATMLDSESLGKIDLAPMTQ